MKLKTVAIAAAALALAGGMTARVVGQKAVRTMFLAYHILYSINRILCCCLFRGCFLRGCFLRGCFLRG